MPMACKLLQTHNVSLQAASWMDVDNMHMHGQVCVPLPHHHHVTNYQLIVYLYLLSITDADR
jgi:hypothetical protein